jgi:hypothetical protein
MSWLQAPLLPAHGPATAAACKSTDILRAFEMNVPPVDLQPQSVLKQGLALLLSPLITRS